MINLRKISNNIKYSVCKMSNMSKAAHLGSSLSCVDILVSVFFSNIFHFNKKNYLKGDKFILSKGHAASALYSILAEKKYFKKKNLLKYGKNNSLYEEHPNFKVKGVICSTGSLGQGLSFGSGIALGEKIQNKKNKIIVLISDGECNEGSTWESAGFASAQKLNNIIVIVDNNKWQATGRTNLIFGGTLKNKWKSFGWTVEEINGHNHLELIKCFKKHEKTKLPLAIVANTIKGKGIKFMEDDNNWHYRSPNNSEMKLIKKILKN